MVRRVVSGVGHTLIAAGVLILLFVAYQLWGTNLAEARSQEALRKEAPPAPQCGDGSAISNPAPPPTPQGDAIAVIKICKLGLEKAVVEGVGVEELKKGPGHYPKTPMPGQPGNAAIAGHRTTYGAPFSNVDRLEVGDPILVSTAQGRFRYEVSEKKVVGPGEVKVLDNTTDNRLTLTTCEPRFSAARRLIIVGMLVGEAVPPPEPPPEPADPSASSLAGEGLSGRRASAGPAVGWGLVAASVWLAAWVVGRVWRRWPAYLVGTPVFLIVLYFFFEDFARLLPANV